MSHSFILTKSAMMQPARVQSPYSWVGHIPFAAWLVEQTEPRMLVELGTHTGNSYFSFCQAVAANNLPTRCFAVDTWRGDEQSGAYGEEVFESVSEHNQRYYSVFSSLLRMTFDAAALYFSDGTIDLLHIDGLHTYEAVKHDFENWQPKCSERAIVVFHDTNVRERDFGVWRLWEELSSDYPHIAFDHSHGLGVLLLGKEQPESLQQIWHECSQMGQGQLIRRFFGKMGRGIEFEWRTAELEQKALGLGQNLIERDRRISDMAQASVEKDQRISGLEHVLTEKDRRIVEIEEVVVDQADRIQALNQTVADRECSIQQLLVEQEKQKALFSLQSMELHRQIQALQQTVTDLQASTSWRITAPIRGIKKSAQAVTDFCVWRPLRSLYQALPMSYDTRYRLRSAVFRHTGRIFRHTRSYQAWKAHEEGACGSRLEVVGLEAPSVAADECLSFAQPAKPRTTVVVVLQRESEMTLRNLKSLKQIWKDELYELILVAAGLSEKEQQGLFSRIEGAVTLQCSQGEAAAWFTGAQAAGGELLLLLRGDVHVLPDCFQELEWVFQHIPEAGLAGAKIIRPDGCIWAAGGEIGDDGKWDRTGAGKDQAHPTISHLREVDFCPAGACMLPKELFLSFAHEALAGHVPEEAGIGLALAVRAAGRKIFYQPLSQVVLNPDAMVGEDDHRLMKIQFARGIEEQMMKAAPARGNLLVIDVWTPRPDQDSGSQDIFAYFLIFRSLGFNITFIPAADLRYIEKYTRDLQRSGVQCLYQPFVTDIGSYLAEHGAEFQVVMLYRAHCAAAHLQPVRRFCPQAKIIFNTVDLHYLREERQAAIENSVQLAGQAAETKELELSLIRNVDATIIISPVEREILLREPSVSSHDLFVIPIIRNEIPGSEVLFHDRGGVVFIGGFQHQPNVDAVVYFISEIWPEVKKSLPRISFFVIGDHLPAVIKKLAGPDIRLLGHVPDLKPHFSACRVAVAPLRYGAGLKGKVVTSLGHGVPCVATAMAVEGTGLKNNEDILIADDPEAFAKAVVRLHEQEDLWQRLSENGLEFVRKNYSLEAGRQKILQLIETLGLDSSAAGG